MDKAYDRKPTLRSRELRKNPTDAERLPWQHLKMRQLAGVRFNNQVPIPPFICDFVARTPKLIIELDGGQHAVRTAEDDKRTRFLESRGYRILRFWNNDVLENVEGVLSVIEIALANAPPSTREGKSRAAANCRVCQAGPDRPSPNPSRRAGGE